MSSLKKNSGAYESWKANKVEEVGKVVEKPGTSNISRKKSAAPPSRIKCCNTCACLAFHRPNKYSAIFNYDDALFEHDAAIFEIIYQVNEGDYNENRQTENRKVDDELARQTADAAERRLNRMRNDMASRGLIQRSDQNFCGEARCARVIAPLHADEIELGSVLGMGGFSAVMSVSSFKLGSRKKCSKSVGKSEPILDQSEELTRQFLSMNVLRYPDKRDNETQPDTKKKNILPRGPVRRYALKHIRLNLANDREKFKRSCIDLVLEGQLLLAMDHPNIIGIRGWPINGTEAIRSGRIMDYFLILDQLPVSLEVRMWDWRRSLLKYKARCSFPFFQTQKYSVKIDNLFRERLQAVTKIASAIEYLHSKQIMHRDIKAANIGFDVRGEIKLFDFGLARLLPRNDSKGNSELSPDADAADGYCMSRVGTKFYIAPEVKNKKPYSLPADVYSFGVLCWEMISLNSPREVHYNVKKGRGGDADADVFDNLSKKKKSAAESESSLGAGWLQICPCWPELVRTLILSCLSDHPRDRPFIHVVHEQLVDLGVELLYEDESPEEERRRRRSTFRIDLSAFQKEICGKGQFNMKDDTSVAGASCISKTSVSSSHSVVESNKH